MQNPYDYHLPKKLIAQRPAKPRNHARLLVYNRATRQLVDDYFYNLAAYLPQQATLVLNNSRVERCRLLFPGGVEIFVVETINPTTVVAMVRPGKKFQLGMSAELGGVSFVVTEVRADGLRVLESSCPIDDPKLQPYRSTPFPPYIAADEGLASQYQTVYAKPLGSKAAPTAGLHFTRDQLQSLARLHPIAHITLHVGLGTFAPIKTDPEKHTMHAEQFEVSAAAAALLNNSTHITAVGTTSVRTLESLTRPFNAMRGDTTIFIKPGYRFHATDSLVTNFHLPRSTLLMLVAAFIGSVEEMQRVYAHAVARHYRFYSFGDAMLIL